jgi:cell division protein FtsB
MTNAADDSRTSQPDGTVKLPPRRREQRWIGRALCFAACVLAVNALIGERGLSETLRARREFRQAVSDLSRIQYENASLASTVDRLRHDADTIESVARAELGLIRPGEILVVVKATSTQGPAGFTPSSAITTPDERPAPASRR